MSLTAEIERFRKWAHLYRPSRYAEWEYEYPEWSAFLDAAYQYLDRTHFRLWDRNAQEELLYVLARNNEGEDLIEKIAEEEDRLLFTARIALTQGEPDAKWQVASRLGSVSGYRKEAEELLLELVADPDEYVRRRALLALTELGSPHTEPLAIAAWESGEPYQRIIALHALHAINSPRLNDYLLLSHTTDNEYVVAKARAIEDEKGLHE